MVTEQLPYLKVITRLPSISTPDWERQMQNGHITVVYKWTANPGKLDELAAIYSQVADAMEQNEPGATAVHCYVSESDNAVYVRPFFFFGDVPDELKAATEQMQLGAEFASHSAGFTR
jgi:hypothetical protein